MAHLKRHTRDLPGRVIALIGPDAAGKTTLATALAASLGTSREIRVIHLGSPPVTLATALSRRLLRLWGRLFGPRNGRQRGPVLQAAFSLLDAIERRTMARVCHAEARNGLLVLTDRFPGRVAGSATGPRIPPDGSRILRWLANAEARIYQSIPVPDLIIRVEVPLEETLRRNAERPEPKNENVVRASHEAASRLRFPGVPEISVDNQRPRREVLHELVERVSQTLECPASPSDVPS